MNKKQIDLLISSGYEVLPEVGFIKENTLLRPVAYITFNSVKKEFGIVSVGMEISGKDNLIKYTQDIAMKLDLVQRLNYYCD